MVTDWLQIRPFTKSGEKVTGRHVARRKITNKIRKMISFWGRKAKEDNF